MRSLCPAPYVNSVFAEGEDRAADSDFATYEVFNTKGYTSHALRMLVNGRSWYPHLRGLDMV